MHRDARKTVKIRRGPATVTGDDGRCCHCPDMSGWEGPTGGRPGSQETCPRTRFQFLRGARGCSKRPAIPVVLGPASVPPISSRRSAFFFCPLREVGPPHPSFPKKPRRRVVRGGKGCPGRPVTPDRVDSVRRRQRRQNRNEKIHGLWRPFHFDQRVIQWGYGECKSRRSCVSQ